ncbi:MAG TPA: hypothetical protein VGJ94_08605 [Syntrophorhabdaceae bacterium]|jgi:hypothetical protein
MARGKLLALSLLCLTIFLVHGCASNKPVVKKDLASVKEITFVRYPSGYMVEGTGKTVKGVAAAVPSWYIFPPLAAPVYHHSKRRMMSDEGDEIQAKYSLPDFAERVHKDLFERLSVCLPSSSKLIYEGKPRDDTFRKTTDGLLAMDTFVEVADGYGLRTVATVKMTDSMNNVLWKRKIWYNSVDHNRTSSMSLLMADGGKKLKEEVEYAVQLTVADLVDDFNQSKNNQGVEGR